MLFTKMHGLGNDYVYVNAFVERVAEPVALAKAMSDRYTGIGSDGLILIAPSDRADVRMEMYNADGSRGRMCGNGIRCVSKYAVEHGLAAGPHLRIETDAGVKDVWCEYAEPHGLNARDAEPEPRGGTCPPWRSPHGPANDGASRVTSVRVNMGPPIFDPARIPVRLPGEGILNHPVQIAGRTFEVTCVSMGNPHAVMFVPNLDHIDIAIAGPHLENCEELFPEKVNFHVARIDARDRLTMKTWERGSGATRACGTGACATAVAAAITNRTNRRVTTTLPGGDLLIDWAEDGNVHMTGPAVEVFTGHWPD